MPDENGMATDEEIMQQAEAAVTGAAGRKQVDDLLGDVNAQNKRKVTKAELLALIDGNDKLDVLVCTGVYSQMHAGRK